MSFVAMPRSACTLTNSDNHRNGKEALPPFVWTRTSDLIRRGRCAECGTQLVQDMPWQEPDTVWLVSAEVVLRDKKKRVRVEEYPLLPLPLPQEEVWC